MQKIIPHLWFDKEAVDAAKFYVSAFPNSKLENVTMLHDTPSGDSDIVSFSLNNYSLMAISAGPVFKLNPSISFILNFDPGQDSHARENLDRLWQKLSEGGKILMPLDKYPFSEHYGWVEDKYGVSWQLILSNPTGEERPFIMPSFLFTQENAGKAEEAINYYMEVFGERPDARAKIGAMNYYGKGFSPNSEESVMFADFQLFGQWFAAMDSADKHDFKFNEALSLMVNCEDQAEIDYYWGKLSVDPESEQCGWLKDKFGVSWQITPTIMGKMLSEGTPEQVDRVTQTFLPMKKIEIAPLEKAFEGK